ncbi:hypothetical protein Pelo_13381 [Pelomyxa schiedti]|nr:hypothetical protein Pelo_13381 [Pelomyxa schiedti]
MSQVRSVLRAKDQFVAVACSHLSFNRANNSARRECGGQMTAPSSLVAPPICHLVSMSSLLTEWGKNWVLSSESTRVFTIEAGGREGWRLVRIHVWVCVSPTLGVVECGTFECDPEFVTCIWAAFGDNNTFLVNGYDDHTVQALFVVDRSGKAVRTLVPHSYEKVGFVGVNSKWLAVYSGNDLVLWKLEDRCLPRDHDGVTVRLDPHNARVIEQSFGGDLSPLDVDKATLWNYRHSTTATTTQVTVVNLETSFNNWKTGAVIDEVLGIPLLETSFVEYMKGMSSTPRPRKLYIPSGTLPFLELFGHTTCSASKKGTL